MLDRYWRYSNALLKINLNAAEGKLGAIPRGVFGEITKYLV